MVLSLSFNRFSSNRSSSESLVNNAYNIEPLYDKTNEMASAASEDSDQPGIRPD